MVAALCATGENADNNTIVNLYTPSRALTTCKSVKETMRIPTIFFG